MNIIEKIKIMAVCLTIIIYICCSIIVVAPGECGVEVALGRITDASLEAGPHFCPLFFSKVVKINIKQQDLLIRKTIWFKSSDGKLLACDDVTVSYAIAKEAAAWVYSNVENYEESLITPELVISTIKGISKKFYASDIMKRKLIEPAIKKAIQEALNDKYGEQVVIISKVIITNINFNE